MHQRFEVDTTAPPERLFSLLSDLSTYPRWLDLVASAKQSQPHPNDAGRTAWDVTLRAKLGPFARSKQLRMVLADAEKPHTVRFDRAEVDGRDHSRWTMKSTIRELRNSQGGGSASVELIYGGQLWSGALQAVLLSQVDDATPKLQALASSR